MFISQSAQLNIRRQSHGRSFAQSGFAQLLCKKWNQKSVRILSHLLNRLSLLGPRVFWIATGKVVLVFFSLFLLMNFWLSSSVEREAIAMQAAEEGQALLLDEHIALKAERARLLSPAYLDEMVAHRLALYAPEKDQVFRF